MSELFTKKILSSFIGKKNSLNRALILWFLILSLLPLGLIVWISYQQATSSLSRAAEDKLEYAAKSKVSFLQSWYKYRIMDLNSQAQDLKNSELLLQLKEGLQKSGKKPLEYVKSFDWNLRVDGAQNHLVTLLRTYDYIYNIFLIDTEGNILYTVVHESDFGTNLFNGPYAETKFSHSVKNTLETGKVSFSDLERYAPSNDTITGFINAPLLDEFGSKIGVFSIQIKLEQIFKEIAFNSGNERSYVYYLVGEDGLLRTTLYDREEDILVRKIDTEQTQLWQYEHGEHGEFSDNQKETAFIYTGPNGQSVIGIHQLVRLAGVSWLMISEIDRDEALASVNWLAKINFILVLVFSILVLVIAIGLARRITLPIIKLADTSLTVASGETNQQVDIDGNNEISELAKAFNYMLRVRRDHEESLEESNKKIQKVIDDLKEQKFALDQHSIVATTDVKGRITYVNDKFCEISGYSESELIGKNHRLLNSGYTDKDYWKNMYHTVANGNVWHDEVCNKAKDGHLYWVDTTIIPFMGNNGKPNSYIAIRTDITASKKLEQNLSSQKNYYETLIYSLNFPAFIINTEHKVVIWNKACEILTGLNASEVIGTNEHWRGFYNTERPCLSDLVLDKDFDEVSDLYLEQSTHPFSSEGKRTQNWCQMPTGENIFLDIDASPILDEGGRVIAVIEVLRDITERKHALVDLVAAKNEAEAATRAKSEFLANMSHEIRTPMNGVLGMSQILQDTNLSQEQRDYVNTIQSSGDALLSIINDILDFSKIEAGKMDIEPIPFDLQVAILEVAELLQSKCKQKGIELIVNYASDTPRNFIADPGRLRQILMNLTGNAIKFTDQGHVLIELECLQQNEEEAELRFTIKDTGIGISEDAQASLFDSFSQADASTTRKFGGTGLGLTISKQLVELMGGYLSVESTLGKGSTFSFTLQLPRSTEKENNPVPHINFSKLRALVVDDNQVNRDIFCAYLSSWKMRVESASSASDALERMNAAVLKKDPFHIALLDYQMPEMDGEQLGEEIKKQTALQETQLLLLTSSSQRGDAKRFSDAGFAAYMVKPINPSILMDILVMLWDYKQKQQTNMPLVTRYSIQEARTGEDQVHDDRLLGQSLRALLVEDNIVNQKVAKKLLEKNGCTVDVAANGKEGVEMQVQFHYDIVFMDCQMPIMDGYEATAAIRENEKGSGKHQVIIAMTANAIEGDREKCIKSGMDDYIAKPVGRKKLQDTIDTWSKLSGDDINIGIVQNIAFGS